MLGSSKTKSAAKESLPVYVSCGSYILSPILAQETTELMMALRGAHTSYSEQYQKKVDERIALTADFEGYDDGPTNEKGILQRQTVDMATGHISDSGVMAEMQKRHAEKQRVAAKAIAHNKKIQAKQAEIEREGDVIAAKMRRVNELVNIVSAAHREPMVFESSGVLVSFAPPEQLILLSVLTKGASISFDAYESRDVRVATAMINAGQPVALVGK